MSTLKYLSILSASQGISHNLRISENTLHISITNISIMMYISALPQLPVFKEQQMKWKIKEIQNNRNEWQF